MSVVRSCYIGHKAIYEKFPGLKPNPILVIKTVEDLFCQCGTVLKPEYKEKKFRQKGVKYVVELFVGYCPRCDMSFDVPIWRELVWRRTGPIRRMMVIEEEITTLPVARQYCQKCGKITDHAYYSIQLRSSDEPETTIYKCMICKTGQRENI